MDAVSSQSSTSIRFPALSFSQGWLSTVDSMERMTRSSRSGFKKGLHKSLVLVDSSGNQFQVVSAEKVRTFVDGFGSLLGLLTGNPSVTVKLTFASTGHISLEDLKKLISESFEKQEDYWEEMTSFEQFRDKVGAATSLEQVFAAFKEFHLL